jgi:hypothetical protein
MANPTRRSWTAEDIDKLQRLAGKRPATEIAAVLHRSCGTLAVKAHKLKISLRVGRKRVLAERSSSVEPSSQLDE